MLPEQSQQRRIDYMVVVAVTSRVRSATAKSNIKKFGIFNDHTGDVIELSIIQRPGIHHPSFYSPRMGAGPQGLNEHLVGV
jgi:hypothetical protein